MQVIRIRVALGHAADELKRAKGIITAAGEGAKNGAIFGLYCFGDGGIILFGAGGGAVGTDEKGFFALGQVLGGVMDHGIMEFGVIDAGGEADAVILRQAGGHAAGDIDKIDLGGFSHGLQDLEGIAVVAGIITDGGFHVGASLRKVIKWCRSRGQAASKTPHGQERPQAGWRPTQGGLAPVKGSDAAMRVLLAAAVQHDYRPFANGEQVLLFGGKTAMIKGDF